jgi:hypothetical protein
LRIARSHKYAAEAARLQKIYYLQIVCLTISPPPKLPSVFFKIGKVDEGARYWAGSGITGWGFQSNDLVIDQATQYWNGYAGGYFGSGHGFWGHGLSDLCSMQLSIIPVDMFAINLGWDLMSSLKST